MVDFTVIIVSIVISMVVTIGIALCCRFFSDHIETFLISIPESLSENITNLRETERKVRAVNHLVKNNWLLEVERILEEARLLLQQQYGSSAHNNDARRSHFCFGYSDRSPIKLQRKVKRLTVEGRRIIAAGVSVGKESTPLSHQKVKGTCDVHDIEKGITVEGSSELPGEPILRHIEEGVHGTGEGTSKMKKLEPGDTAGFPDIEEAHGNFGNVPNIKEATNEGKTSEDGVGNTDKELSPFPASQISKEEKMEQEIGIQNVPLIDDSPDIGEGSTAEESLKQAKMFRRTEKKASQTTELLGKEPITSLTSHISKKTPTGKETLKQKVELINDIIHIKDYDTMAETFSQVVDMLGDNGIRKIGIWGPGGVGKTTLVHTLYNKLDNTSSSSLDFSLVILISVTRDVDPNNMQKAIAARLNLMTNEVLDTKEVANQIRRELQREKFLLILDDVWESVDLSRIGIPENQMGSKIILTTRILEVCKKMEAEVIKLNYLSDDEAWEWFCQQFGVAEDAERRALRSYKALCRECGGLPLVLVSVGSFLRGELNKDKSVDVIKKLQNCISFNDTVSKVYLSLKLSYDLLENDILKSCFLYCSLFPKRGSRSNVTYINVRELVECWLAENLIDNNLDYVDAFSEGLELIRKLKNCSLLEEERENEGCIRMNCMAANVARWIAESEGKSLDFYPYRFYKSPDVKLPKEVENLKWISFMASGSLEAPECGTNFPKATTIIFHDGPSEKLEVLEKLLQGSGELRVLKIENFGGFSGSLIHSDEIRALLLRNCNAEIGELPDLPNLMVTDFSKCRFGELPRGIKRLTSLRALHLSDNSDSKLESIDEDVICGLEQLEVLDMRGSFYGWPTRKRDDQSRNATLQDLSKLKCLKAVYVRLADVEGSYEEFEWMENLRSFVFYYRDRYPWESLPNFRCTEKIILIKECEAIGSFILHAEILHLYECNVDDMLLEFSTSEKYSSSKLKSPFLEDCYFYGSIGTARNYSSKLKSLFLEDCYFYGSIGAARNYSFLSNLEELQLFYRSGTLSFYSINNAIGGTCTKLKSLEISFLWGPECLFSSEGLHMKLPELEKITVRFCHDLRSIFDRDPSERQAAVPNLKELVLEHLPLLESLSNNKWNDQWASLETLIVSGCPKLRTLPRMSSIKEIRGSVSWWNNLVWDSEESLSFMKQRFKPRGDPPTLIPPRLSDSDEEENYEV